MTSDMILTKAKALIDPSTRLVKKAEQQDKPLWQAFNKAARALAVRIITENYETEIYPGEVKENIQRACGMLDQSGILASGIALKMHFNHVTDLSNRIEALERKIDHGPSFGRQSDEDRQKNLESLKQARIQSQDTILETLGYRLER